MKYILVIHTFMTWTQAQSTTEIPMPSLEECIKASSAAKIGADVGMVFCVPEGTKLKIPKNDL